MTARIRPLVTLAHITDTHFTEGREPLSAVVDSDAQLAALLRRLEDSDLAPDALVLTGDLAEAGAPSAYRRLRVMVESSAATLGALIVWVPGNHDSREVFHRELLDHTDPQVCAAPVDAVHLVGGLRIVAVDTSVPGHGHGEVTAAQLEWLAQVLAEPAPLGTIVAMHHPPLISPIDLMNSLELRNTGPLADVLRGSDVRAILSGHLHYATTGTFAGIPVSVSAASSYTLDVAAPGKVMRGQHGGQSFNIVQVYPDTVVHSVVPAHPSPTVYELDADAQAAILKRLEGS